MNRLENGRFWLSKLNSALPYSSARIRIRLAWHLAALRVESDDDLAIVSEAAFQSAGGKLEKLTEMRTLYLESLNRKDRRHAVEHVAWLGRSPLSAV